MLRKLRNVAAPRAKRRHVNLHTVQPIVQVGPKAAFLHEHRQTSIGRDDEPDVHTARSRAADAFHGQILKHPQQLGLRREREIGHFVQEERAAVRVLELPAPAADPRRGSLFYPEQLGLEQRFDERGAIDRDERPTSSSALLVKLARDELLAGPALAFDEHGEIGRRHA